MSLSDYKTISIHGLYSDLLKQFIEHGDKVYIISPFERKTDGNERIIEDNGATIIKIKIFNMQKTNIVEKGISMLTIDELFIRAIKKYFANIKFDLILYPTPPITILKSIKYVKKRDHAKSYLLLKDIFPQNAVDLGLMSKTGVKGILYKYFRNKEKELYSVSDFIGCMSQANVDYVLNHNPEINPQKVEVCPNSTDPIDMSCTSEERIEIRKKYGIPLNKTVFVYGGNLGKPQGIPFIIKCLHSQRNNKDVFFLIVGSGTEYGKIQAYIKTKKPTNVKLMEKMPKDDYDKMIGACDIGMIFLDHRFTIPNFPSRLLAYMQAKLPVLAVTDLNTDIGKVITEGNFGWWCESNNIRAFNNTIHMILKTELCDKKERSYDYFIKNFSSEISHGIVIKSYKKEYLNGF